MLSVLTTDRKGEIFADQFAPVEEATKASGLPFAIARMPLFLENIGAQMQAVKETGKFYTPVEPHKKYNNASVADLGPACAKILVNANQHHGKTYNLVGSLTTETEFAAALSKATGKEVTHVHVPYDACKQSFLGMGFPEWMTDGIIELFKNINADVATMTMPADDTIALLGRNPTTVEGVAGYMFGTN